MKFSLSVLALVCAPSHGFLPAATSRPSFALKSAAQKGNNYDVFESMQKQALAYTAASLLSVGMILGGDALPAFAATAPTPVPVEKIVLKKQAPVEKVTLKKQAPEPAQKKALDQAKSALDAVSARLSRSTKEARDAKADYEKADALVKKCEASVKQAKSQFLNENDKLLKTRSDKSVDSKVIAKEQERVGTSRRLGRIL